MTTTEKKPGKTIAIFGAGPGLGSAVAARFGAAGYRVALVARRQAPLDTLVGELARSSIEATAFAADLTKLSAIPSLVRSIEDKLGSIDVAIYTPTTAELGFVPAVDLDGAKLREISTLFTFAPVEVAHAVLPGMLARGDGAIVFGAGLTAIHTVPGWSGVGPAMAAARNYIFTLNAEVKDKGVYAGTVTIGALIERSAGHAAMTASGQPIAFPVLSPESIAEEVWALITKRDRVEAIVPPLQA